MGYVPVELSMVKALGYADFGPEDFDLLMRIMVIPAALTVRVRFTLENCSRIHRVCENSTWHGDCG